MEEKPESLFEEIQRVRQAWIFAVVIIITVLIWYGAVQQLIFRIPFGNNPPPDPIMVVLWIVFGILFPIFFFSVKLITQVRSDGVYYRFFPFHLSYHKISLDEISKYEKTTYKAIKEYGGWGIRRGKKGKAYNISGNQRIMFKLKKGRTLMIGSQKPDDFKRALDSAFNS